MRIKRSGKQSSPGIYDDADEAQVGQHYPERHQASLRTLHERYPDYSADEVDAIYRQACRLESEIEKWSGKMELSPGSKRELFDWLEDHFHGFTQTTFSWALERVEDGQK